MGSGEQIAQEGGNNSDGPVAPYVFILVSIGALALIFVTYYCVARRGHGEMQEFTVVDDLESKAGAATRGEVAATINNLVELERDTVDPVTDAEFSEINAALTTKIMAQTDKTARIALHRTGSLHDDLFDFSNDDGHSSSGSEFEC